MMKQFSGIHNIRYIVSLLYDVSKLLHLTIIYFISSAF